MSNIERALRRATESPADVGVRKPAAEPVQPPEPVVVAGVWNLHPNIVAYHQRYSAGAEAFRKLAAKLLAIQRSRGGEPLVIGVTSSTQGEGKSITATNLAVVLAQDFRVPTLMIDCDLRRPMFGRYMGLNIDKGLSDVAYGTPVEDAICGTPLQDLLLLSTGKSDNPTAVFEGGRFGDAIARIRPWASVIVCDCPPVLPVADTPLLAPHLDGMLVVVRAGYSQKHSVRRTLEALDKAPLFGFVLNYADVQSPTYYHADYYHVADAEEGTEPKPVE